MPSNKKVGKVSIHADLSRALRKALGGVTQAELAAKLLVSRNYISQIEASLKTPSDRLEVQMRQMLTAAASGVSKLYEQDEVPRPPEIIEDPEPPHEFPDTVMEMRSDVLANLDQLISMAGNDIGRLGWLREEMRSLAGRVQWRVSLSEREAARAKLQTIRSQVETREPAGMGSGAESHG